MLDSVAVSIIRGVQRQGRVKGEGNKMVKLSIDAWAGHHVQDLCNSTDPCLHPEIEDTGRARVIQA